MSSPRAAREMVFCHSCRVEWPREEHGLTCPRCHSDFVEVIEANNDPHNFHTADHTDDDRYAPPSPLMPLQHGMPPFEHFGSRAHPFSNLPTPQPANNGGLTAFQNSFQTPEGNSVVISRFSYTTAGVNRPPDAQTQVMNSFGGLLQGIVSNLVGAGRTASPSPFSPAPGTPRDPHRPPHPFDAQTGIMSQFFVPQSGARSAPGSPPPLDPFHHGGGFQHGTDDAGDIHPVFNMMRILLLGHPMMMNGHGDAAYSQEEFDRIMSQLMEQSQQGGGEPPASQDEIARIPKRKVDQEWLDAQESKECTICMEEAKVDEEISELWCGHWYHPFCIKQWLDAHGACPLCRKTLKAAREEWEAKHAKSANRERRRSSRPRNHSQTSGHDSGGCQEEGGSSRAPDEANGSSGGGFRDRFARLLAGIGR